MHKGRGARCQSSHLEKQLWVTGAKDRMEESDRARRAGRGSRGEPVSRQGASSAFSRGASLKWSHARGRRRAVDPAPCPFPHTRLDELFPQRPGWRADCGPAPLGLPQVVRLRERWAFPPRIPLPLAFPTSWNVLPAWGSGALAVRVGAGRLGSRSPKAAAGRR